MLKLQLTKGRIILWILAAAYGVYTSYVGFYIEGPDTKSKYTDYKIIQKYFDHDFEDLGEVSWRKISQECHQYHLKKNKSLLQLDYLEKEGLIFSDVVSPTTRFMTTTLEKYTQYASEGLSPTVDEAFISEALMKEVYEINKYAQVNTVWKNVSVDKKCYHLLESISAVGPESIETDRARILKRNPGLPNE